jgi:tetratricopeptide (TPR) repeat protein
MIRQSRVHLFVVCLSGAVMLGCARHQPPSLADRVFKPGKPSIEVGSPPPNAPKASLEAYIKEVRHLASVARPNSGGNLTTSIESQTPALQAALLKLRLVPSGENHRLVGEAYREVGVLDVASQHLSRAIELDPTDARAYDGLARIWRDWGFPNLGLGDAYRAVHYAPDSPEAYNTLGTLLQSLGQHREARKAYERALTLDSQATYALNNLCYLSFLDGNADRAVGECQTALKLTPRATATRNNLGLAYASLGELQSAHREFSSAGRPANAAFNVGIVNLASGHYNEAADAFEQAYVADPKLRIAVRYASWARQLSNKGLE